MSILTALTALALSTLSSFAAEYSGQGITFNYSDDFNLKVTGKGIKTVRVLDKSGTQFLIQNYKKVATPEGINKLMLDALQARFPAKCTLVRNKHISRSLFGVKRSGDILYIHPKPNVLIECVIFTFSHEGNSYCVITQQLITKTVEAERFFDEIQRSLRVTKDDVKNE